MTTNLACLLFSSIMLYPASQAGSIIWESVSNSRTSLSTCGSRHLIKNGSVHNSKPKYQCKAVVANLLSIPLKQLFQRNKATDYSTHLREYTARIARATQVSWSTRLRQSKLAQTPRQIRFCENRQLDWLWMWRTMVCVLIVKEKWGLYLASDWPEFSKNCRLLCGR